jgi:hypothetical protein
LIANDLHWLSGSVAGFSQLLGLDAPLENRLPVAHVETLVQNYPRVFSFGPAADKTGQRPANAAQASVLDVNTEELAKMLADKKSTLRSWLAGIQDQTLSRISPIDETWQADDRAPPRIVVVSAGFHSPTTDAEKVARALHKLTNLPMCLFEYPNDAPIAESAGWLIRDMNALHGKYPTSKFTFVAHSMGGLVARGALELPNLALSGAAKPWAEQVGVDQLIQVCPPNHGSALAEYGQLLEGVEVLYRLVDRSSEKSESALLKMITDGFNEASDDLQPDSDYLQALNKVGRAAGVRYTILAGAAGPLNPLATTLMSEVWDRVSTFVDKPMGLDRRVRQIIECEELQQGKGDGVVSLTSASLEGVEDTQTIDMHHLTWIDLESEAGRRMLSAVAASLKTAP